VLDINVASPVGHTFFGSPKDGRGSSQPDRSARPDLPIPYPERPKGGEQLFNYAYEPPKGVPTSNGNPIEHDFEVTDIRAVREQSPFTLKKHGFKLVNFPAGRAVADWAGEAQVNFA
jgi:hypothetical protein